MLMIMSITTPLSSEKKIVLPKSIRGNSTFTNVSTYTYEENELVEKKIIINCLKKEEED
jgi:hypothetical protein